MGAMFQRGSPMWIFIEAEVVPQVALLCVEPIASVHDRPLICSAALLSTSPNARAGPLQFVCETQLTWSSVSRRTAECVLLF
jgi:hypothetical protein